MITENNTLVKQSETGSEIDLEIDPGIDLKIDLKINNCDAIITADYYLLFFPSKS